MKSEVEALESTVLQFWCLQKDDDSFPSDTIVEQAANQHALLKNPKSMDKKEEDISGDASVEVHPSPETTAEAIKACLPETGIKLTATSISSVDDTQHTHDDIEHQIPSAEKGDTESIHPKEQEAEIMQTSLHECSSINMIDSIDKDSEVIDVEHDKKKINVEVSQIESMLLKPDIQETAEYGSDKMKNENFSKQIVSPIEEKSTEQPFYEESRDVGDTIAQVKAEDDSSMKTAEIQVQNKHIALSEDQESKSPQALSYEKESDNEGMSLEDAQQISEKIPESRNVSCEDEEAEPTSEPQQSYQEVLEPSQIKCERGNDSKENANDNSTEREVTASAEEMLIDSSSTIEATEKSSEAGLEAETGPVNRQENDEHQTCQTEVEENDTILEMAKQNQSFPESELQETNVISTQSISYDNANVANAALDGDNDKRDELKAEEIGDSFIEENVLTATREPYSSEQISSTDENSVPISEKGDSAISTDSDKITSLNDNVNTESIGTEAKLDKMQKVENKREIVVGETAFDGISEEIIDESDMVSEKQVDSLTLERNTVTDEPCLIVDSRQHIPLPEEDQPKKVTDVREKECEPVREHNSNGEENESISSPDKDTEKDFEANNEEIQYDSKAGQAGGNESDVTKQLEIVNPEIEETKLDQGEQNQENSIHYDAIGADGDAQAIIVKIEPTSPEYDKVELDERVEEAVSGIEQKNIENEELHSIRDAMSAEVNLESSGAEGKLEDSTDSTVGENNVTPEASIYKGDDQDDNQSSSVSCVDAEDTIDKTDDSGKEVDFQYTEETQSTRDATVESFQRATTDEIEDHKNFESANSEPSQQHDETTTNSNYNEELDECKEQEPSESNEFHSEDEINNKKVKNQVDEEESSGNTEGIRRTVEVSQSQDECSKLHEDSLHDIGVEETTDRQHEEQEDKSPYGEHDSVLADQVKAIDTGMDSQKENELSSSSSDGVLVQEDQTEREACKYDEMDESDTRKDKELMSHEFEQDKLVNKIISQTSSPPIAPLEHNVGAVNPPMNDPTASKPSEIVNDEALPIEASKAAELEAEQHIQTNDDPEQENYISADKCTYQGVLGQVVEFEPNLTTPPPNTHHQPPGHVGGGGLETLV
ncbi:hypothetical protein KSS87_006551 [Heliosperma pusillum]|nr:hypothetical protein KSS87_006551 [Heliosperma pusillum]